MSDLPSQLLLFPLKGTRDYEQLTTYIEEKKSNILTFFPWFTAELLDLCGAIGTIDFLTTYGSRRVPVKTIFALFPNEPKFHLTVERNCAHGEYIEIQSATGFFDSLRRFVISENISSPITNAELAALSGTSIRSIQRLRKRNLRAVTPAPLL